jgi:signal transduction histidine kinase
MENQLAEYSEHLEQLIETRTKELTATQQQLVKNERLAAIGELAGMVGHDLRNPLASIKNATYFMKKKVANIPEKQTQEMLNIIDNSIEHADKIINDLLDYARELHLELGETSPQMLFTHALELVQVPEKVKIVNKTSAEPKMSVDIEKIERVFVNLIKNAIDALPNVATIEIRSIQSGPNIELSFADTGVGITDDVLQKIFSPLFTTKAQGMGFGLAIFKRLVVAHVGQNIG